MSCPAKMQLGRKNLQWQENLDPGNGLNQNYSKTQITGKSIERVLKSAQGSDIIVTPFWILMCRPFGAINFISVTIFRDHQ
jgi:hypothetical protein